MLRYLSDNDEENVYSWWCVKCVKFNVSIVNERITEGMKNIVYEGITVSRTIKDWLENSRDSYRASRKNRVEVIEILLDRYNYDDRQFIGYESLARIVLNTITLTFLYLTVATNGQQILKNW